MSLKTRITEDLKNAMRSGESSKRDALRLLQAAIKQREVDERVQLDDAGLLVVIEKMLKQRRESIAQFEAAARIDLAQKEKFEVSVLEAYLPQPLAEDEIKALVEAAVQATGATGPKDMGKVMAQLKPQIAGRADGAKVSALVKSKLAG